MTKKIAILGLLVGTLSLGACANAPERINDTKAQLTAAIRAGCGFVPLGSVVLQVLATWNPLFDTIDSVARGFCDAVTTAPLAEGPGGRVWEYRGVAIRGHFR